MNVVTNQRTINLYYNSFKLLKYMKYFLFLLLITITLSCKRSSASLQVDQNQWLIDSLALENYVLNGKADFPKGISPLLIKGYTDRVKDIYHLKELNLESLHIISFKFEKKEVNQIKQVYYYQFLFNDKKGRVTI